MLLRFPRRSGANARFVHPLAPPPRTAILVPGFHSTRLVRVFQEGWSPAAEKFAPAAIAAPFDDLLALADAGVRISHAVIPLAWDPSNFLTAEQRETLWQAFGAPIFEQYLGPRNVLLASECEAHQSLHVTPAYTGPVSRCKCPCGSNVRRLPQGWSGVGQHVRPAVAAYALSATA
jgi:hypothetical protein